MPAFSSNKLPLKRVLSCLISFFSEEANLVEGLSFIQCFESGKFVRRIFEKSAHN